MKKNLSILILILSIFFINTTVYADGDAPSGQLAAGDIEIECIYDNGVAISVYYYNGIYGMSASDFKLKNMVSPPYDTSLTFFYNESAFAADILKSATCPNDIRYGVVQQKDADGNSATFEFYYRYADAEYIMFGSDVYDEAFFKSNVVAGFTPVSGEKLYFMERGDGTILGDRCGIYNEDDNTCATFYFNLVNERIHFNNSIEPKEKWAFKSEGVQAASKVMYYKVSEYVNENGDTVQFAEKDGMMTKTTGVTMQTTAEGKRKVICVKPATKNIETDNADVAYSFSGVRHNASWYGDVAFEDFGEEYLTSNTCDTEGYSMYVEVDWNSAGGEGENATSICDIIPETALILAEIVNYARIIVPAFLIILTGIDISRIVIAGNIDEELPKRKKTIFIRLVVSLVFFFLPLIVGIITAATYGVDFGDVSCIWQ